VDDYASWYQHLLKEEVLNMALAAMDDDLRASAINHSITLPRIRYLKEQINAN
jgi:hypothetical protein